jgi:hypothetical protein
MRYHKKILPSARAEFTRISQTYGTEFAGAVRVWRDGIVAAVSSGAEERLMDASVQKLLERVLQEEDDEDDELVAMPEDAWEHARQRFREASWRERARAALAFFRSLAPPWELRVSRCTFSALGIPDMLELFAYYEVNHADRCIVFTKFEIWTVR